MYVEQHRKIPAASTPHDPLLILHLPTLTVAKIMLWNAMIEEGVTHAELARRMGYSLLEGERLLDFLHGSEIQQVERALGQLGRRLSLVLEASKPF